MGMIIEKYIGKAGRKLFMLFCWLFTLLVIAAFTDMVAGTFVGKGLEDSSVAYANSAAASISMLFILVAVVFGLIQKGWKDERGCESNRSDRPSGCYVCNWYASSDLSDKVSMDLYHHDLSVLSIRYANVASDAA